MKMLRKGLAASLMMAGITLGQALWGGTWAVSPASAVQPQQVTPDFAAHPAKDAILLALQKGFMWQYPDGRFYPDKQIAQSQFVASLVAIRGVKDAAPVPELPAGHWAKGTYERAKKAGILEGIKIDPNKLLTKEEAALLVFNAWKPYRGVKMPGYTNTGALITWGWMDPAPAGQPKFREDLPVTRGDAAKILGYLWKDKWQLELGDYYADEFHNSLKSINGVLKGTVPKGDNSLYLNVKIFTKDGSVIGFENGEPFQYPIANIKEACFIAINRMDSSNAARYFYNKIPSLLREKKTIQFSKQ
ncbi:S-layer homology domain-containing protein [Brevibacillus sp. GCM10020057]|uniref:S-layer homology domain-containing protein n=1 Tax=Brevibacillus sp. GCM10020057 TaxID=3317327 RepID=UPI003644D447